MKDLYKKILSQYVSVCVERNKDFNTVDEETLHASALVELIFQKEHYLK